MEDIREAYENDSEFREYVNRYAKKYQNGSSISVEEALTHKLVFEYLVYLRTRL